jgi:hypothetical protein
MITLGQTITGKRYNKGGSTRTVTLNTTQTPSGGTLVTSGKGTDVMNYRNANGRYAASAIAQYRESESVTSINTITYNHDGTTWQATGGEGTVNGSRSWDFSYRPKDVVAPFFDNPHVFPNIFPYMSDINEHLIRVDGTSMNSTGSTGYYSDSYQGETSFNTVTKTFDLIDGKGSGDGYLNGHCSLTINSGLKFRPGDYF